MVNKCFFLRGKFENKTACFSNFMLDKNLIKIKKKDWNEKIAQKINKVKENLKKVSTKIGLNNSNVFKYGRVERTKKKKN